MLGSFATFGFVTLFIVWMALLVSADFGLIFYGQAEYVTPAIPDFWTALYVAGSSILTLGSGDASAMTGPARLTAIAAAFTGIVIMAIAVSFMFTMQSAVQKREITVNTLDSRLGTSTTGLGLLLRYKELDLSHTLGHSFNQWELWAAELLESHRAFPLLSYFRSAKSCVSWVTILGALLDASAITIAATSGEATGDARLFFELATRTVQSLTAFLNLEVVEESHLDQATYSEMLIILSAAGYKTRAARDSYLHFNSLRLQYASYVKALSGHLVSLPPSLLGNLKASIEVANVTPLANAKNANRHLRLVR